MKLARELARELRPGDRVLLEGEMGAGKTTFARALLGGLGVSQPPEGSPTFAIAHEYRSPRGEIVHLDFYRLKDESELEDAGIHAYYWEREAIVIAEWASLFPRLVEALGKDATKRIWGVRIDFLGSSGSADLRAVRITQSV